MPQQTFYTEGGSGTINNKAVASWSSVRSSSIGIIAYDINDSSTHYVNNPAASYEYTVGGYSIWRSFLVFDTSFIPSGATITSAELIVNFPDIFSIGTGPYGDVGLVQTTQASTNTLITDDFDQCGLVDNPDEGATRVNFSVIGSKTFTLNSTGLTWLNKGGITKLGLRADIDIDNTIPNGTTDTLTDINTKWVTADQPKLIVNFDVPKAPLPQFFRATT